MGRTLGFHSVTVGYSSIAHSEAGQITLLTFLNTRRSILLDLLRVLYFFFFPETDYTFIEYVIPCADGEGDYLASVMAGLRVGPEAPSLPPTTTTLADLATQRLCNHTRRPRHNPPACSHRPARHPLYLLTPSEGIAGMEELPFGYTHRQKVSDPALGGDSVNRR